MKMYVQMSWCLRLLSWKVDGVCEWKWQAMVIHRTAFSSFTVLCERYNLITKIHLSFFHMHRQERGCFPSSTSLYHNFFLSAGSRGLCVGPGPRGEAVAAPWVPGLAGPCAGASASAWLHPSEGLCAFQVMPGSSGLCGGGGGGRENQTWGLSAGTRAFPGAIKKGCETKMNLNVPKCLLEWHPEPSTLENYL